MKKIIVLIALIAISSQVNAQIPGVSLVTGIIKKVIVAIDIKVQQLQNQTLALQNTERALENDLSLNKLDDISGWLDKERALYKNYYDELARVRSVIAGYQTVKRVISQQAQLVAEYKSAWAMVNRDAHFSPKEIAYMGQVYDGILAESVRNLDELLAATTSLSTQMSDGERLEAIRRTAAGIQTNLDHLRQFNRGNTRLSLLRAKDEADKQQVRTLYGLN